MKGGDEAQFRRVLRRQRAPDRGLGPRHARGLADEARLQAREAVRHRVGAEIQPSELQARRPPHPANITARSAANTSSASVPAKQLPGLDQRDQAARGHVDALEHAAQIEADFAHQPVLRVRLQQRVGGEHAGRLALAAEGENAERGLVQAQMQDRVIQRARQRQRPERGARRMNAGEILGKRRRAARWSASRAGRRGRSRCEDADR